MGDFLVEVILTAKGQREMLLKEDTMVEVLAPGKLNLGLNVLGIRPDGYHMLDTVFVMVDIFDTITLEERKDNRIVINCDHPLVPNSSDNIVWQAVRKMQAMSGVTKGAEIVINKRIPVGGGMAGGSSDAAAVLRALPYLWKLEVERKMVKKIACQLGADVLYCFLGGVQRGKGIGTDLTGIVSKCKLSFAVLPQPYEITTSKVFKKWDALADKTTYQINDIEKALVSCDNKLLRSVLGNALEPAVIEIQPELEQNLTSLRSKGFNAQLTGSGSTIFVVLDDQKDILRLQKKYNGEILQCSLLTSLPDVKCYTK